MIKHSTRRQDEAILSLRKGPLTTQEIANALGVSKYQVHEAVRREKTRKKSQRRK